MINPKKQNKEASNEELTDLKDILQFGVTLSIFLPVLLRYFLLINLYEYEANKFVIAYYISVGIWIMNYFMFYLCKPCLKRSSRAIMALKSGALTLFALEAIWIFFLSWVAFTKGIPLSYTELISISYVFIGMTLSLFYLLPFALMLIIMGTCIQDLVHTIKERSLLNLYCKCCYLWEMYILRKKKP